MRLTETNSEKINKYHVNEPDSRKSRRDGEAEGRQFLGSILTSCQSGDVII